MLFLGDNTVKITQKLLIGSLILVTMLSSVAASPAELTIFPQESSSEINSFTSYSVEVRNVGPVSDRYDISSSSPEQITLAPQRVPETGVLEPGESEEVQVWYNPTSDMDAGTYSFSITARSQGSDDSYSEDARVNVIKDHDVSLNVQESMNGCVGEEVRYDVEVSNDGIQEETFQLTARYDGASFSEDQVTLQPDETREVTMLVSADSEVEENFNVVAASTSSYAQTVTNVNFNTEICYESDVTFSPSEQDVAAFQDSKYEVTIRNTGTKNDTFALSANTGTLSDTTVNVPGNSERTVTLTVRPETLGEQTIEVTAESTVTSTGSATMNVFNGMDVETSFTQESYDVCEDETFTLEADLENTGDAEEAYSLSTDRGTLEQTEVTLTPGESTTVEVTDNTTNLEPGSYDYSLTTTAETFGEPVRTTNTTVNVEDCWGVNMNVVPNIASAGENKSVIYEIQLNNTGTRQNTYNLSKEGPEWISIRPESVTIEAGETQKAFMYAGIPFGKDQGEVLITATATGTQVTDSEEVKLLIGKEIEEAINSGENNGPTGGFASRLPTDRVNLEGNLGKVAASLIIGLMITAAVLYREW
mgnify:CR=1 FL=1